MSFRGHGKELQYKICADYLEPGHLSLEEIRKVIADEMRAAIPSGRQA